MARKPDWRTLAPKIIYQSYPDSDLLPIEPPKPTERIESFKRRAKDAGDTLFLFLCLEADDDCGDADEYMGRLDRSVRDIESVQNALLSHCRDEPGSSTGSEARPSARAGCVSGQTIRLDLGSDWIELWLGPPDTSGQVSGRLLSNLRSGDDKDNRFTAAMDAIEAMILAHGCAGLDVRDPRYIDGIRTCLEACTAQL